MFLCVLFSFACFPACEAVRLAVAGGDIIAPASSASLGCAGHLVIVLSRLYQRLKVFVLWQYRLSEIAACLSIHAQNAAWLVRWQAVAVTIVCALSLCEPLGARLLRFFLFVPHLGNLLELILIWYEVHTYRPRKEGCADSVSALFVYLGSGVW